MYTVIQVSSIVLLPFWGRRLHLDNLRIIITGSVCIMALEICLALVVLAKMEGDPSLNPKP